MRKEQKKQVAVSRMLLAFVEVLLVLSAYVKITLSTLSGKTGSVLRLSKMPTLSKGKEIMLSRIRILLLAQPMQSFTGK